ncbi:hypothetical protein P175DRAFT_0500419 [Aspergillus ochraceoroseus IBT 24754]|uniref:Uncharacterized protein n=1 Tax=Aspergillus ochraceoroseus IBT 24754 TaxID=1392256 RepID=A0A2T5LZ11_9EURO|nr:uncharacterized protein P175DRAFT_0500419 [Aspergillus ochraceoroseus IBT 24754]PTU21525.1 hypothetical protein P175DRAFT_0500419 [Aspergillus ochraceoroseus IBT 24754]
MNLCSLENTFFGPETGVGERKTSGGCVNNFLSTKFIIKLFALIIVPSYVPTEAYKR